MSTSKIRIKRADLLLYIYLIGVMCFYTIQGSNIEFKGMNDILLIALIVGVAKIINTFRVELKTFLIILLLGGIILFIFLHNRDTRMMIVLVSLLCTLNEEKGKIINVLFYTKLIVFVIAMLSGGYHHINTVALHGGMVLLLYICKRETHNYDYYKKLLVLVICSIVLVVYTNSGSALVGMCATILLFSLKKFKVGIRIISSRIIVFCYPIALLLNYFFAAGVGESEMPYVGKYLPMNINHLYLGLVEFIDTATSSRLTLVKYSFLQFGASWLGGNVNYNSLNLQEGQYFNLDSGFIWLVQGWGYLMCIVLMILCVLLMKYFVDTREYNFVIAGIVIALWAINEDMLVSVGTNFLLIFLGHAVWYWLNKRKVIVKNEHT